MRRFVFGFWLVSFWALAAPEATPPTTTALPLPVVPRWQLGAAVQMLLPSNMPNFISTTPALGVQMVTPLGLRSAMVSQITYGTADDVNAVLLESSLRLPLPTPYLPFFFSFGGQALYYSAPGGGHTFAGLHLGPSLIFSMSKTMDLQLALKLYLQSQFMTSFGGSLLFPL